MTDATGENIQAKDEPCTEVHLKTFGKGCEEKPGTPSDNLRELSYMVLFIAAVFVVNAMETGSYRTPWPVAIITAILGFGLFGYSWYLRSRGRG
jgi:hypothetical protein